MIIFVKFKRQNVVCTHEFSSFNKKVVCTTTYDFLGILALISGALIDENICSSKSETAYFSAIF